MYKSTETISDWRNNSMKVLENKKNDAFFLATLAAFCGGSVVVSAKIALEVFQPFTLVFIRFLFATIFMLPFVLKTKELSFSNSKHFALIGIVGSFNPILLFIALQFTQASVSPLIYASVPALTAVYLFILYKDKPAPKQLWGIVIGFIGVSAIVLLPFIEKSVDLSAFRGNLLIFLAAIAFMFYGILSKKAQKYHHISPIALTFYFCFFTLLISIPFSGYEIFTKGLHQQIEYKHIFNSIYVGVVGTGIFYLAYQYALKLGSEVAASLFTYLQPIATIILAILFLSEKITPAFIIGGILAVVGARLASSVVISK